MSPEAEPAGAGAGGEQRWGVLLAQAWYLLPLSLVPWLVAGGLGWMWLALSGPWLGPALRGFDPGRAPADPFGALLELRDLLAAAPRLAELALGLAAGVVVVWLVWLALQTLLETMVVGSICLAADGVAPRFGPVWDRAVDRYNAVFLGRVIWLIAGVALTAGVVALAAPGWQDPVVRPRASIAVGLVVGVLSMWLNLATQLAQAAAVDAPLSVGAAVLRGAGWAAANFVALYLGWIRIGSIITLVSVPSTLAAYSLLVARPGLVTVLAVALVAVILVALTSMGTAAYWTLVYRDLARATAAAEAAEAEDWTLVPDTN